MDILGMIKSWFKRKTAFEVSPPRTSYRGYIDSYKKFREPTDLELFKELKNTAWTCATINASVCANYPPKLYVKTFPGQPQPKCKVKQLPPQHPLLLQSSPAVVEEVT